MVANDYAYLAVVAVSGVLGGLLRLGREAIMHPEQSPSKLEWIVSIGFGFAGGNLIFLIVPGSFSPFDGADEFIKLLGLALVGGFVGGSIIDRILPAQLEKVQEDAIRGAQRVSEQQDEKDAEALALVGRQLDKGEFASPVRYRDLAAAVSAASASTKVQIFQKARDQRKLNELSEEDRQDIEKTIPVFKALIDDDQAERFHRTRGQMGFACHALERPEECIEWLTKAINIRSSTNEGGFYLYEYIRARALIRREEKLHGSRKAGQAMRERILSDLRYAKENDAVRRRIEDDALVVDWLSVNGLDLAVQKSETPEESAAAV